MIHLVVGRQGSGKTIYLVKQAYEAYSKGKSVYSNVKLNFPYKPLNYQDIVDCKLDNGIVIIDEMHLLLPARNSMNKTSRLICDGFLSMVRKKGLELYGSTQTPRKIDIRVREECDYFYIADKFAYLNKSWKHITHNQDLDTEVPVKIKIAATEMFSSREINFSFTANRYYALYDTNQIIKVEGLNV